MIRTAANTQGFTLIELMIAMTLGVLMLSAAIEFVISNNRTYQFNDDFARIQENGTAAVDILTAGLRQAGYQPADHLPVDVFPKPCISSSFSSSSSSLQALCNRIHQHRERGVLALQYVTHTAGQSDCTGKIISIQPLTLVSLYSVEDIDGDGIYSLYCQAYSVSDNAFYSHPTPLVDGIDAMQVFYRVFNPTTHSYRYRLLQHLTEEDVARVSAVSVTLLVNNGLQQSRAVAKDREYLMPDQSILQFPDDRHLRHLFSTTTALENQLNGGIP